MNDNQPLAQTSRNEHLFINVLSKFFLSLLSFLNRNTKEWLFTDMKEFAVEFSKWEGSLHRIMSPIVQSPPESIITNTL